MSSTIQLKRGTRAQITALAAKRGLLSGEPLLITDENRLAVATDVNAFEAAARQGETGSGAGTVTSVSGTGTVSGLTLTGTVTTIGNLTLGGTLSVSPSNFSSQTAKTFLAAPNAAAGVPTFRTIVASDIPTLNQNTTGTASNVTGTVAIANGGTGATTASAALSALGAQAASTAITTSNIASQSVSYATSAGTATTAGNVTGVVSISNGGTGATTASAALTALGAQPATTAITTSNIASQSVSYATNAGNALLADGINGIIDITEGGTGASTAANARANLLPSYTGNAGKALIVNGTESDLIYAPLGGTGTVTSVGISVPAFLTADNTPITTSGTISIGFSGTALPVLNGGTGATSLTGVLIGNGTGAFTTTARPSGSLVGTTATQTLTNKTLTGLKETRIALPANDIDIAAGNYFTKTISTATTFTVSNVPTTGTTATFILDLTDGGIAAITWWSGVKWQGGTTPTLTASGRDVLGFFTHDAGVTWSGLLLAKDIK